MLPLLLIDSAIFYFALVDIQQFAEIINLSKLHPVLYLYGFEGISFLRFFCVKGHKNDGVLKNYNNYITVDKNVKIIGLRQYRTIIVERLRSQFFRQIA